MEKFFNVITGPSILVIAILELALTGYLVYRFVKTKSKLSLVNAIVTFGLFFDAFFIALGMFIDAGSLPFAGRMRFVLHGILIPLLFIVAERAVVLKKPWNFIIYGVTFVFIVLGFAEGMSDKLVVVNFAKLSRFVVDKASTPKWAYGYSSMMNVLGIVPLIVAGINLLIKRKNPYLLISGVCMFGLSVLGLAMKNYLFFISMIGELLMVIFILVFELKDKKLKN